jgi:hypothetical protein
MFEDRLVVVQSIELTPRLPVPLKAKPAEVFQNPAVKFVPHAGVINIFEANQKSSAIFACKIMRYPCCIGMAEVEFPGGTWGKAGPNHLVVKKVLARWRSLVYLSIENEE